MKFLIPTEPDDTHAILVKLALEDLNHCVDLIFTADQPTRQKNSVFIDTEHYHWKSIDAGKSIVDDRYDIVWWRRPRKPHLPQTATHPNDYPFVLRENMLFYESFTHNIAPQAWWINRKEAAHRANFKLLQLKLASECGLIIPTTLCSNDPDEIRDFLIQHQTSGVIYKPLCSNFWFESDQMKIAYTARVRHTDLPPPQCLQQSPGIFQKEILKSYELRITCFGDFIVAAKLDSQKHIDGLVDWRAIRKAPLTVEPYALPTPIQNKIRTLMRALGIVFGSFDFIVTPQGEYIFLEVNEQGQFLWIEEYNPQFKMLDIFIHFLLNQSNDFTWQNKKSCLSIEQYRSKILPLYQQNMAQHVCLNLFDSKTNNTK